jgi:hypothetical protein
MDEGIRRFQAYSICAPCVGSEVNVTGRKDRSGNFGGKIDELVKQFPHERPAPRRKETGDKVKAGTDDRHINDRLFDAAWRKRH